MKEIRQIKEVVSMEIFDDTYHTNDMLNKNIRKSDLFYSSLVPLFRPGHESELVYFLKAMGLIMGYQYCNICGKSMKWGPSRNQDLFEWKCLQCNIKKSLRENSPLMKVKCNFKSILICLNLWCLGFDAGKIASHMGVQKHAVLSIFELAVQIATFYMINESPKWKIGGDNVIVLIDDYPGGWGDTLLTNNIPILCISEVKVNVLPPLIWFEALEKLPQKGSDENKRNKNLQKCLSIIESLVHKNSIIVARDDSTICSFNDLLKLKQNFKQIISTRQLETHNTPEKKLDDILAEIWREASHVCKEVQVCDHLLVPSFLISYMWRKRLGTEAYQVLINQIAAMVK